MSEYVYGRNSIKEALDRGRILKAYVLNDHPLLPVLRDKNVKYEIVDRRFLDRLSKSANHQGIIGEVKEYRLAQLSELIREENGLIVMLDGIQDPHNLGAIIRTCECAGVDGVIYKKHNSVKLNDTVAKVACGALEYVKVVEETNLVNTIRYLKERGYWIVGTSGKAKEFYDQLDYKMNVCLIIGSEGSGMSRLVSENCDFMVKLPLKGKINSLNASVAAGIMVYNILSKRAIH